MNTQNNSCRGIKRRRANSPSNQNKRLKVNISDDTWLEALKFLNCPEWSQKRFVGRKINGIAERNISRLPKMVLDSAQMYYVYCRRTKELRKLLSKFTVVAFETVMQKEQSTEWFKKRGYTLDAPEDIPEESAMIRARKLSHEYRTNAHMRINGYAEVKISLSDEKTLYPWFSNLPYGEEFRKTVLYYAQFNPVINQYSWDYLAQFLKFVYHPTTYVKNVEMFAVNQKFVDLLKINIDSFDNEPIYIRCGSFELGKMGREEPYAVVLPTSLKWLVRNVRAETVHIPCETFDTDGNEYVILANFVLDPSGAKQCASKKIKISVAGGMAFLNILTQKFRKVPLVECAIPAIKVWYREYEEPPAHLGPNLIAQEVDSQGADALFMISSGQNRMRISFRREDYRNNYCNISIYSI